MIPGMDGAYVFPTFVLHLRKPRKNLNEEYWPDQGSNPLRERQSDYYQELPGSIPSYTLEIFLERGAPSL